MIFLHYCLTNLERVSERCKDKHLTLNWEKDHIMVKKGIVVGCYF